MSPLSLLALQGDALRDADRPLHRPGPAAERGERDAVVAVGLLALIAFLVLVCS